MSGYYDEWGNCMDLGAFKIDPGALIMGALWGVYVIGQQVFSNWRGAKKQDSVDSASAVLIQNLQKSMTEFASASREERERADRLAKELNDMSVEMGGMRIELRHANEDKDELKAEVGRLSSHVEALVAEIRNKDKSIESLVDLNRKILKSIGSTANPTWEAPPKEENVT